MHKPLDQPEFTAMSFGDHLDELRKRLLYGLMAPIPVFILLFFFSARLVEWILLPVYRVLRANDLPTDLQALSPPEVLLVQLKLSVIGALVVSAPWLLYQAWLFIAPGLYQRERRFIYFLMPGSAILTTAGVCLLYFIMLPLMLHVLIMFGTDLKLGPGLDEQILQVLNEQPAVQMLTTEPTAPVDGQVWFKLPEQELFVATADDEGAVTAHFVPRMAHGGVQHAFRVSFVVNFTLVLLAGIVIAFQMPLVIALLGWLGLVDPTWLRERRKYALVVCGVVSAMITPADAASMLMMLIPLYLLYELGILLLLFAPAGAIAKGRFIPIKKRSEKP